MQSQNVNSQLTGDAIAHPKQTETLKNNLLSSKTQTQIKKMTQVQSTIVPLMT